jgi:hypothetical protein
MDNNNNKNSYYGVIEEIWECWGIQEKTLHPQNVGFAKVHEISFWVMCENNSQIWLLRVKLLSISGRLEPAKIWNHKICETLES